MAQTVLIIDPDSDFLEWAQRHLSAENVRVLTTSAVDEGMRIYEREKPDLVLAEHHLGTVNGIQLLKHLRQQDPNVLVVLATAFPSSNAVIEAMKLGAFDFLGKESLPYALRPVVENALKSREVQQTPASPVADIQFDPGESVIIGRSPAMQGVFKIIGRVSRSDAAVMITGESGCGKEVVARAIQKYSLRTSKPFVAINCAAIPENLLESELFGHEKGSFTGATTQRTGRFEQCDGGTLFLDEIGEMPMHVQTKILRVLQEGEYSRVGGNETLKTDVRIIAATNRNLEKEVEEGRFREDLFYRLNVVRIHIPPLRERPEDIRLLSRVFLERLAKKRNTPGLRLSEDAYQLMESYNWPGNVRELENTIQRAAVLAGTEVLTARDIPLGLGIAPRPETVEVPAAVDAGAASAAGALLDAAESEAPGDVLAYVQRLVASAMLERERGSLTAAARRLGIKPAALRRLLSPAEV